MKERSTFIKSTFILVLANTTAKILGAVFKIPLSYILKEEGMAIYQTTFTAYSMFLSFVISGFPFATTKILAEYYAKDEKDKVKPLVFSVMKFLAVVGGISSVLMYLFAPYVSVAMREPMAKDAIRLISPAILFVAIGTVIKSSNEASSCLLPTALSQVLEAVFKLFLGLYLAYSLSAISTLKASEGAVFSVTVGELFATLLLLSVWLVLNRKLKKGKAEKAEIKEFFSIALPLMLTVFASSLLTMANVTAIRHALTDIEFTKESAESFLRLYSSYTDAFDNLIDTLTLTEDGARKLFGAYSGYAETVFNLPLGIIATASAAATPMFVRSITKSKIEVSLTSAKVISAILFLALPATFLLFFFSEEILKLIYNNAFSSLILKTLSPSLIFISTNGMLVAILHLSGKIFEPFIAMISGQVIKIILSSALIRIPEINILGISFSIFVSSFITFILLYIIFKKNFTYGIGFARGIYKPLSASLIMSGIGIPLLRYLNQKFAYKLSFLITIAVMALVYLVVSYILNKRKTVTIKIKGVK